MFADANEPLALLVAVHPKIAKQLFRQNIYKSWNHQCAYCGNKATSLDHVIPKFKGGKTIRSNLVPACQCNHHKGSENWKQWFQRQSFWTQDKEDRILGWMQEELTNLQWSELNSLLQINQQKPINLDDRLEDICAA